MITNVIPTIIRGGKISFNKLSDGFEGAFEGALIATLSSELR